MTAATKQKNPTIQDRLEGLHVDTRKSLGATRRGERPEMILDGLKAKRPPTTEGEHWLSPEELLTLTIPEVQMNGRIRGYQREFNAQHARRMAAAMGEGTPFPPIIVAITGRGTLEVVEGQHRAGGGVIARRPVWAVFHRMDKDTRRDLFTGQRHAKRVNPNTITLSDEGSFQRYIKEAIESNDHPWSEIVSHTTNSKTRIGPYAMFQLLVRYVANAEGQGTGAKAKAGRLDESWDRGLADELAPLIACFGNKESNPAAFKPTNLQSIGATAMWVFRRHEESPEDRDRWMRHMPTFQFARYVHIRTQTDMTEQLIRHWNKKLRGNRRVER